MNLHKYLGQELSAKQSAKVLSYAVAKMISTTAEKIESELDFPAFQVKQAWVHHGDMDVITAVILSDEDKVWVLTDDVEF